jgi:hypothetical protein
LNASYSFCYAREANIFVVVEREDFVEPEGGEYVRRGKE